MPRRSLVGKSSFEQVYELLTYTAVALELSKEDSDAEVADLAGPVLKLVLRWETLDRERREQRRLQLRANALCKRRDIQLDAAIVTLHADALAHVAQDRQGPLFARLFPKPVSTLTRPALQAQVPIARMLLDRLVAAETPTNLRKAHDKALKAAIDRGEAALREREVLVAAASSLAERIDALRVDGDAVLLQIEGALALLASKRRLGKEFVYSFFPEPGQSPKKPKKPA